jgi:hypothetical protein
MRRRDSWRICKTNIFGNENKRERDEAINRSFKQASRNWQMVYAHQTESTRAIFDWC